MVFSLIEGLTALAAFGILIIVNNNIYDYIKRTELNKDKNITAMYLFFPILGIAYLTGFLGYIIINSEFILVKNIDLFILVALILTITITHFRLFNDLISNYYEGTIRLNLLGIVSGIWGGLLISFMQSPTDKKAVLFFFIFLLPIMLWISPKLKDKIIHKTTERKVIDTLWKVSHYIIYGYAITAVIDILLTYYLLTYIKGLIEINPIAFLFQEMFGKIPGLIILTIIFLLIFVLIEYCSKKYYFKKYEEVRQLSHVELVFLVIWNIILFGIFSKSFYIVWHNVEILIHNF